MPKRSASAMWSGDLKGGKGTLSTESGVLKGVPYSYARRFENEPGTNPEELVAAAHAGCFSMAFSNILANKGMTPERVETSAVATFEKTDAGFAVTEIHLECSAKVGGADKAKFDAAADEAKRTCPISRLLAPGTRITLNAKLA